LYVALPTVTIFHVQSFLVDKLVNLVKPMASAASAKLDGSLDEMTSEQANSDVFDSSWLNDLGLDGTPDIGSSIDMADIFLLG
jgi:hypothetical protein